MSAGKGEEVRRKRRNARPKGRIRLNSAAQAEDSHNNTSFKKFGPGGEEKIDRFSSAFRDGTGDHRVFFSMIAESLL